MPDQNAYDSLIQNDTAQRVRVSMMDAVDKQPDTEAKLQGLAKAYGMPVDAVRLRQPEIERQARLDALDYDTLANRYPKTANALANPNAAAIAHDDVDNMSGLERWAKYLFSHPSAKNTLMGDIGAGAYQASRGAAGVFQAATEAAAVPFDFLEQFTGMGGNPLRRLAEGFAMQGAQAKAGAEALSPAQKDVVGGGVSSGVQSFTQNMLSLPLAFLPGGQPAALSMMSAQTGGQSYQDAREKGVDQWTALQFGASQAAIEYATEKLPLSKLIGDVTQGAPIIKSLLHNAALEIPGEQIATVLQDMNEWAVLHPEKAFSDYLAERPSAAAQTLIATLIGVGGNVTLTTALQKAADNAAGTQRTAQQAEARAQVLGELAKLAEASKVRERDPAQFAQFMQSVVEEGVPHLYVDANALAKSVDLNAVALALPSVAEQITQAMATGGDVVIPTQELLTAGPGNEFMQSLIDNARTTPEAMSPTEAREYMQAKGDQLRQDIDKVLAEREQDQTWQKMRDDLRAEFKTQLDQAKRFTSDVNNQYATLLANFYSVTAAKLGISPQELAQRYGLQVRAKEVQGGQQLDQAPPGVTFQEGADNFIAAKTEAGQVGGHVRDGALRITYAEVAEEQRGKGEGIKLYTALVDKALDAGLQVFSDSTVEAPAVRMYKALKRRGYDVQRLEGGEIDGAAFGKGAKAPAFQVVAGPKKLAQQGYDPTVPESTKPGPTGEQRTGADQGTAATLFDTLGLPNQGRDLIQGKAEELARALRDQGFEVDLQHSGSVAGPSSYLRVYDPQTGRLLARDIRLSGHSKGAFNSQGVWNVTDAHFPAVLDAADRMRALGPSELLKAQDAREAEALRRRLVSADKKLAKGKPLTKSEQEAVDAREKSRNEQTAPDSQGATLAQQALPTTIEIDGKQRPTTNSNGQPIAATEEGVRNFWKWFGDSKVVDAEGRPLVVYHSTLDDKVQFNKAGKFMGYTGVSGISVTDNPEMASRYLDRFGAFRYDGKAFEKNVMPLYVKAENPLERDEPFKTSLQLGAPLPDGYVSVVERMGHDALIRNDAISRKGPVKHSDAKNAIKGREIVVFNPTQIKSAIGNSGEFDPANPSILRQDARGSITLPTDITKAPAIISLFKGADLSTFIHESGHFFLEVQADLAARIQGQIDAGASVTDGEREIVADMDKLLAWFGVKGDMGLSALDIWHTMTLEEKRAHHEQFARGFEAYAFEGSAPSVELQGMFQKFRAWMLAVYKDLKALNVNLTDDVRGVMDRMLASTEAIQEAEAARRMGPLFKTAEEAGMSLDEFAAYHALATDATQSAINELQARGLRDMRWLANAKDKKLKELQAQYKSLRSGVRAEIRGEVMSQPVYRAWQFLTGKGGAQETAQPDAKVKSDSKALDVVDDSLFKAIAKLGGLNKDEAISLWGVDPKEKIESGVFGTPVLRKSGGLSVDAMAARLTEVGYLLPDENGTHDVNALFEAFDSERRGSPVYSTWHEYQRPNDGAPVEPLPDYIAFGKLNTSTLAEQYGAKEGGPLAKLQALRMTSEARGIHPDVVAETFGFTSGDELIRALLDAEPPARVIEGLTDQRMLERYGDLGTLEGLAKAADRAIHNEARARFVATEIRALETGMRVRAPGAAGRSTVDVLTTVARQQAEAIIARTKVRDLRPGQYAAAEARAARAAEKAMLAGKTEDALAEKRHQIINLQAAKATMKAQDEMDRTIKYLRKFDEKRPKGIDAEYLDQIDALLVRFDLAPASLKAIDKRKTLVEWVESQREQGMEPDIPPELLNEALRKSYKDMTVEELRGLRDTVRQIEKLGRNKNKLLTAKAAREFAEVRDEIHDSIVLHAGDRKANTRTPADALGRSLKAMRDFGAAHIKAATYARVLDGGIDGGPVWEYLIRTANDRGDMETAMRAEATQKLYDILEPVLKGGKMHGKGQYFASIKRSMNREQVLAMALNMGNESNIQRMLGGEGWTIQQVMPVVQTLTASDWATVQAVWDHFETYRPLIGAKEKRIYGKEPEWVEAMPFAIQSSDGVTVNMRGGYYPIKYDPLASNRAEQHNDAEAAKRQLQGAYTSATTRRGFTKARAAEVNGRPLLYSLQGVYSGVNDVIHDLAWHEWLIDANKILRSDKIDSAIREHYGPEVVRQFKTWVRDVAAGEQGLQAELDSALGRLRHGVSIAGLGFNVMSAVMQPLGLTQSIVRVGAKWVGKGMAQYVASPIAKTREVNAKSDFMANRSRTRFRELNEIRNQVEGEHPIRTHVGSAAYFLMMRCQQMVDTPTWLGAYEKAISEGNAEDRAIALADQAVIDAQGGGQTKDLAAIERGGPAQKLFTVFYSFMNTALNAGVAKTMTADTPAKKAKLAADYLMLYTVPAVLGAILKDALTPGDSGDWDEWDKAIKKLLAEQIGYLFGLLVVAREFGEAAKSTMGLVEHSRDYSGPAGTRLISDTYTLGKQVSQGELDDPFRKAAINVLGDMFALPSAQINRTITGAEALSEGETQNPGALVFGYQKP